MQVAIYSKIGSGDDLVVLHRSVSVGDTLPAKFIYKFNEFALANISIIRKILIIIKREKVDEIILPHSHVLNRLLPLIFFLEGKIKVSYIEDGAATWRFLKKNSSLALIDKRKVNRSYLIIKLIYKLCLYFDTKLSLLFLAKISKFFQNQMPVSQYSRPEDKDIKIYTSFDSDREYNIFVNLSESSKNFECDLVGCAAFFLSPRYLKHGAEKLVKILLELPRPTRLCLVLHPTFWKSSKKELLGNFFESLEYENFDFFIFEPEQTDLDVTFELFHRGCRVFWNVDSTAEITLNSYPKFFDGSFVINLQKAVTGKENLLLELGREDSHYEIRAI